LKLPEAAIEWLSAPEFDDMLWIDERLIADMGIKVVYSRSQPPPMKVDQAHGRNGD